jgi:hypothetical protein
VDASFCSRCGTRVDDQAISRARARVERLRGYLPRDLSDHFLAAGTDSVGEQRQVTVVFIDLVQSTELIRALGDETMADLLDELMGGIAGIVNDPEYSHPQGHTAPDPAVLAIAGLAPPDNPILARPDR